MTGTLNDVPVYCTMFVPGPWQWIIATIWSSGFWFVMRTLQHIHLAFPTNKCQCAVAIYKRTSMKPIWKQWVPFYYMSMKENKFGVPCSVIVHDKLVIPQLFIEVLDVSNTVDLGEKDWRICEQYFKTWYRDFHLVLAFQIIIQTKI